MDVELVSIRDDENDQVRTELVGSLLVATGKLSYDTVRTVGVLRRRARDTGGGAAARAEVAAGR